MTDTPWSPPTATDSDEGPRPLTVGSVLLVLLLALPFVFFVVPQSVGAAHSFVALSDDVAGPPAPAIEEGDIVFVYETTADRLERGDVVTYRSTAGDLTAGRIVGTQRRDGELLFETSTDGAGATTPRLLPADRVVGTVTPTLPYLGRSSTVLPYLGYVVLWARTPLGFGTLVSLGGLAMIGLTRNVLRRAFERIPVVAAVAIRTPISVGVAVFEGAWRLLSVVGTAVAGAAARVTPVRSSAGVESDRSGRMVYALIVVVLLIVVLPFVVFAVPQLVGASNSYIVVSDSMAASPRPVLNAGDVVFVYETPPEDVRNGDVITYLKAGGQVVTHRVAEVQHTEGGLYFKTRGDANEEADRVPVPAGRLVGTVGFSLPLIGHVLAFAGTTPGFALLVIVPLLLLVGTETWQFAAGTRSSAVDPPEHDVWPDLPTQSTTDPEPGAGDRTPTRSGEVTAADSAQSEETLDGASDRVRYTLTRMDLRLTLLVLTTFGVYSTVIAVFARRVWATIIATTALASLALLGGLYYWGGWDEEPDAGAGEGSPDTESHSVPDDPAGGVRTRIDEIPGHSVRISAALRSVTSHGNAPNPHANAGSSPPAGPNPPAVSKRITDSSQRTDSSPTAGSTTKVNSKPAPIERIEGHACPDCSKAFDSEHGLRTHYGKLHGSTEGLDEIANGGHTTTRDHHDDPGLIDNLATQTDGGNRGGGGGDGRGGGGGDGRGGGGGDGRGGSGSGSDDDSGASSAGGSAGGRGLGGGGADDPDTPSDSSRPADSRGTASAAQRLDHQQPGTIELTTDEPLDEQTPGPAKFDELEQHHFVTESGELTAFGRLFMAGMLGGSLAKIRQSDDGAEFGSNDVDEIWRIVERRERELADRLDSDWPSTEPTDG